MRIGNYLLGPQWNCDDIEKQLAEKRYPYKGRRWEIFTKPSLKPLSAER
ncbi:MAG: hypothetical protein GF388_03175 [Candidatus Aegiribacteria sp.]|nr:hypothetical protein [Candidatus Aegiribacteria sp.]